MFKSTTLHKNHKRMDSAFHSAQYALENIIACILLLMSTISPLYSLGSNSMAPNFIFDIARPLPGKQLKLKSFDFLACL
jgi:hypothetical protein